MKKLILAVSLIFLAAGCNKQSITATNSPAPATNYSHRLQVGSRSLMVEVADTAQTMQQGLSGRASMADGEGMLFNFGATAVYPSFWMKDMDFNLDFIWITQNKIIGITPNVPKPDCKQPSSDCILPNYYPPSAVNEVLEANAGWAQKNRITVGDAVVLN